MNHAPAPKTRFRSLYPLLCLLILAACASPTEMPPVPTPIPTPTPEHMTCTLLPYAADVSESMSAFENEYAHIRGAEDSLVTLLVFTDFNCPGCASLANAIAQVESAHPGEVRLIVHYLPDGRYDKSVLAQQAAEAAHLQDKYWEMYALLFEKQAEWYPQAAADFPAWLVDQAAALGLDAARFEVDFNSEEVAARVQQEIEKTAEFTFLPPLLFINNTTPYTGMADASSLDQMVRLAILEERKFHECPDWSIDPAKQYIVTMRTSRGEVVLQLYPEKAPLAVNNFVFLARQGWFDEIPFYRVDAGFAIQSGDPSGTGYGNPGYYFMGESAPGLTFNQAGMLAMANVGSDTNGSLFFITFAPAPQLAGQFTIFGEVLTGMEILERTTAGELLLSTSVEER